jgi:hypothetical protein
MKKFVTLPLLLILSLQLHVHAQTRTDAELKNILTEANGEVLKQVLASPDTYRVQIIYTRIERNAGNKPSFTNYYFNYDPKLYFNPASVVKMPLAFLALEKLNQMKLKGVDKYTSMQIDSTYLKQVAAYTDSTSANKLPSIAHYIKRALLISENDPYNRLYQFMGQGPLTKILHQKGYPRLQITRQFMGFTDDQNRHTNGIRFLDADGANIYTQPPAYNTEPFDFSQEIKIGKGYMAGGKLVNEPFNFTVHNKVPLEDFQQQLQSVLFPKSVAPKQRFHMSEDDRRFLLQYLSQYPSETNYPKYDGVNFYDSYVKFFFRDSTHRMPDELRVFNKVGWAYGFLTDVSYVSDFKNQVEFMLSATVYANGDGILNDGKYDYDALGYPFLNQLGQTIYQHELKRSRKHRPDLSEFRINYEQRDRNDKRPVIREADN